MTRRTILVTGGAGFIGSNIVRSFADEVGHDVVVCDRLWGAETGKWRNLAGVPIADIFPPEQLASWLERHRQDVDLVVHMGAISSTTETDVDLVLETNFRLSRDLFDWCATHQKRLIYASSAATYGDGSQGFDDSQDWAALARLRPLNPYGWSKTLFDLFALRRALDGRAPPQWVGLKFFNVYGPNESHKGAMRSVIAQIWPDVAAGRAVRLFRSGDAAYADGGQLRDFVYVRDAVDVIAWLDQNPGVSGIFNLGSGVPRTFEDLATAVFNAAGQPSRIEYIEMPAALSGRYQYFTEGRIDRLRGLGWNGKSTSLEDGVADYVDSHLAIAANR